MYVLLLRSDQNANDRCFELLINVIVSKVVGTRTEKSPNLWKSVAGLTFADKTRKLKGNPEKKIL